MLSSNKKILKNNQMVLPKVSVQTHFCIKNVLVLLEYFFTNSSMNSCSYGNFRKNQPNLYKHFPDKKKRNLFRFFHYYFLFFFSQFFPSTILATNIEQLVSPTTFNIVAGGSIIVAIIVKIGKAPIG